MQEDAFKNNQLGLKQTKTFEQVEAFLNLANESSHIKSSHRKKDQSSKDKLRIKTYTEIFNRLARLAEDNKKAQLDLSSKSFQVRLLKQIDGLPKYVSITNVLIIVLVSIRMVLPVYLGVNFYSLYSLWMVYAWVRWMDTLNLKKYMSLLGHYAINVEEGVEIGYNRINIQIIKMESNLLNGIKCLKRTGNKYVDFLALVFMTIEYVYFYYTCL